MAERTKKSLVIVIGDIDESLEPYRKTNDIYSSRLVFAEDQNGEVEIQDESGSHSGMWGDEQAKIVSACLLNPRKSFLFDRDGAPSSSLSKRNLDITKSRSHLEQFVPRLYRALRALGRDDEETYVREECRFLLSDIEFIKESLWGQDGEVPSDLRLNDLQDLVSERGVGLGANVIVIQEGQWYRTSDVFGVLEDLAHSDMIHLLVASCFESEL